MRDYITPLGGFLVIGSLVIALGVSCWRIRYWKQRADHWFAKAITVQTERLVADRTRFDRLWRRIMVAPSPIELSLSGDYDDATAADYLILDSGCVAPNGED